jgi:hypothetical protein
LLWIIVVAHLKYGTSAIDFTNFTESKMNKSSIGHSLSQLCSYNIARNPYRNRNNIKMRRREQLISKIKLYKDEVSLERERKRRSPVATASVPVSNSMASVNSQRNNKTSPQPTRQQHQLQQQQQQQQQQQYHQSFNDVDLLLAKEAKFDSILQDETIPPDLPSSLELWVCSQQIGRLC